MPRERSLFHSSSTKSRKGIDLTDQLEDMQERIKIATGRSVGGEGGQKSLDRQKEILSLKSEKESLKALVTDAQNEKTKMEMNMKELERRLQALELEVGLTLAVFFYLIIFLEQSIEGREVKHPSIQALRSTDSGRFTTKAAQQGTGLQPYCGGGERRVERRQ